MFLQCNMMKLSVRKDELNISALWIHSSTPRYTILIVCRGEGEKDGTGGMVIISITEIMVFHYFLPKPTEAYISCPYPDPESAVWEGRINERKSI